MNETIATVAAPAAIGPYSQAVRAGGFIFCSSQLGLDPLTGALRQGVAAQTEQVLDNLTAVLAPAGPRPGDVVEKTLFQVDMADFAAVNAIYGKRFASAPPARATVQVVALPKGGLVAIEMMAYVGG